LRVDQEKLRLLEQRNYKLEAALKEQQELHQEQMRNKVER